MPVNWVGVEKLGDKRILEALSFALNGKPILDILHHPTKTNLLTYYVPNTISLFVCDF